MSSLPSNRGAPKFGLRPQAPIPSRVQLDNFGSRQAAVSGAGRPSPAPPEIKSLGRAQGKERFVSQKDKLDAPAVARALNAIQAKVAESTAQARANPLANGRLFQNVKITGTPTSGNTASRPPRTSLPTGFMYFDTTLAQPLWLSGTNWVDSSGSVVSAAGAGALVTTAIDHGFGTPAIGFLLLNVQNAVVHGGRIAPAGDSTDDNTVRLSLLYSPLSSSPILADLYVYC